jgi:hypothetical protein
VADLGDRRRVGGVNTEVLPHLHRALDEQAHGIGLGEGVHRLGLQLRRQ